MCDLADGLKLCTCEGERLDNPDWILERRDDSLPEEHRRGRAMRPRYSESEKACLERILAKLTDGTCFDFDYTPQDGDVLTLRGERRRYRFRFGPRGWSVDESTALTGWRAQMVFASQGKRVELE